MFLIGGKAFSLVALWCSYAWAVFDSSRDEEAKQKIDATKVGHRFEGNTTINDYFKLLERDGSFLLIGARNYVYKINIDDFSVQTLIHWPATTQDTEMCILKGKSKEDCHNYIRILAKDNDTGVLVCGTNAFKPTCRRYSKQDEQYRVVNEFAANGVTPYDPSHNSSAFFDARSNQLFAGTVADFGGADALISRRRIDQSINDDDNDIGLRTERNDIKCLNEPNFVSSTSDERHVYFWFRESAVEYMNCGKAVYSRVGRVCKNDRGGSTGYSSNFWTSFVKARLNCSLPGEFPFYFDEIAATTSTFSYSNAGGDDDDELIYAVFNTPYSMIRGSAVCAYSMKQMREVFRSSPFKSQQSPNSNWLPLTRSQSVLSDCDADAKPLSEEALNFVRKNSLLDAVVPNFFQSPLIVQTGFKRFTQIAVDRRVRAVDDRFYDVVFVATDDGKVIKLVNLFEQTKSSLPSVVVETSQIFQGPRSAINNLQIFRMSKKENRELSGSGSSGRLVVVTDEEVRSLPVYNCDRAPSCRMCVRLQDPYCAWDTKLKACVGSSAGDWMPKSQFVQNVTSGVSMHCFIDEPIDDAPSMAVVDSKIFTDVVAIPNSDLKNVDQSSCNCRKPSSSDPSESTDEDASGQNRISVAGGFFSPSHQRRRISLRVEHLVAAASAAALVSVIVGLIAGVRLSRCGTNFAFLRFLCGRSGCIKRSKSGASSSDRSTTSMASDINRNILSKQKKILPPSPHISSAPINAYEYETPHRPCDVSRSSSMNTETTTLKSTTMMNDSQLLRLNSCNSENSPHCFDNVIMTPILDDNKNDDCFAIASPATNQNNNNNNYSTLPKDYKVKKTYL